MAPSKPSAPANPEDDIDESLWNSSPPKGASPYAKKESGSSNSARPNSRNGQSNYEQEQTREEALREELASVRRVNETIEGVIESLEKAKSSMKVFAPAILRVLY